MTSPAGDNGVGDPAAPVDPSPTLDYAAPKEASARFGVVPAAVCLGIGVTIGMSFTLMPGIGFLCPGVFAGASVGWIAGRWRTFALTRCVVINSAASLTLVASQVAESVRRDGAHGTPAVLFVLSLLVIALVFTVPGLITAHLTKHSGRHLY